MTFDPGHETVERALVMLTIAHDTYSGNESLGEINLMEMLGDENGEIDWRDVALGLSVIAHLLLDTIPNMIYDEVEAKWTSGSKPAVDRLTGSRLLQIMSLHLSTMGTTQAD